MRMYDLVLVIKTTLSETERKKFLETVKGWLKPASPQGGDVKVTKEDLLGQKVLAYSIRKEAAGFFAKLSFEGDVVSSDLNKKLIQHENILRHLLIRTK